VSESPSRDGVFDLWVRGATVCGAALKRVLEELKWDIESFQEAYKAEIAPGSPTSEPPTPEEIAAVKAFLLTGDYEVLMERLDNDHPVTVNAIVTRVIRYEKSH